MKEETNDLLMAQATSGLKGGMSRAAAKDSKNARDIDAEMRKRRLAKNALLAVSKRDPFLKFHTHFNVTVAYSALLFNKTAKHRSGKVSDTRRIATRICKSTFLLSMSNARLLIVFVHLRIAYGYGIITPAAR